MMHSSRAKCYLWYSNLCNQNVLPYISRWLWTFHFIYKMIFLVGKIKMNITYVVCFHYTTRCVWYAWKFLTNFFVKFTFSNRSVISENMVAASIQFQTQAHTMPPCRSQCFSSVWCNPPSVSLYNISNNAYQQICLPNFKLKLAIKMKSYGTAI